MKHKIIMAHKNGDITFEEREGILRDYPTCPCGRRLRSRQKKYCSHQHKADYSNRSRMKRK